jgi:HEPN domain-containing protein
MSDPKCARALLEAADRNILTLRAMTVRAPDESVGFHVQQATDKALKAWLCALGQMYPLTHDLDDLLDLLASQAANVGFFRPLAAFTPYAVQFRYEGLGAGHEPIDRRAVLDRVQTLMNHVRDRLAEVR